MDNKGMARSLAGPSAAPRPSDSARRTRRPPSSATSKRQGPAQRGEPGTASNSRTVHSSTPRHECGPRGADDSRWVIRDLVDPPAESAVLLLLLLLQLLMLSDLGRLIAPNASGKGPAPLSSARTPPALPPPEASMCCAAVLAFTRSHGNLIGGFSSLMEALSSTPAASPMTSRLSAGPQNCTVLPSSSGASMPAALSSGPLRRMKDVQR
mmetsp:Transcript_75269/g.220686  ORF Transcript_75269/g.220686 Transcript_75269/m.220686 type:complete len:210 (-) Transcript_75269:543-1172(-)